jgi:hypothetical protein
VRLDSCCRGSAVRSSREERRLQSLSVSRRGLHSPPSLSLIRETNHQTQPSPDLNPPPFRGLTAEEFPLLLLPAGEFAAIRLGVAGVTKEEALAGKRVAGAKEGGYAALFSGAPVWTVNISSTLDDVRRGVARGRPLAVQRHVVPTLPSPQLYTNKTRPP